MKGLGLGYGLTRQTKLQNYVHFTCDNSFVSCDSGKAVIVNDNDSTIRDQFAGINEIIEQLYELIIV